MRVRLTAMLLIVGVHMMESCPLPWWRSDDLPRRSRACWKTTSAWGCWRLAVPPRSQATTVEVAIRERSLSSPKEAGRKAPWLMVAPLVFFAVIIG
jgi:hypothetical protein